MRPYFFVAILLFFPLSSRAWQDTLRLKEVIVTAERSPVRRSDANRQMTLIPAGTIRMMPVSSLHELLIDVPGVDVRQRGPEGVQADVSIRGGTFDQVLVMVDGVKISDPQTGHHNFNLPLPLSSITRLEVLKGGASRVLGPDAFAGAVNLITRLPDTSYVGTEVAFGQYGYYHAGASGGLHAGKFRAMIDVGHTASNGYRDNTDFGISRLFFRGQYRTSRSSVDVLAGWLDKGFGANGFYSPAFPDQYEKFRTALAAVRFTTTGRKVRYEQSVYWRRARDEFRLFRYDAPAWYKRHNYHRTGVAGTEMKMILPESFGRTNVGLELRREGILSTVLGEKTADSVAVPGVAGVWYDHRKYRNILSAFVEQQVGIRRFAANGGFLLNRTGDYNWKIYGGLDMGYRLGAKWRIYTAVNQSLRYPTFTDLYYHSPVNKGNPHLKPEEALTLEAGGRHRGKAWSGSAGVFIRKGKNLIDWIRPADSVKWHTMNHTFLTTTGFELSSLLNVRHMTGRDRFWLEEIRLAWAFATASRQHETYLSKYAMDYLHHQVILDVKHILPGHIETFWQFVLRDRAGSYQTYPSGEITPYKPYLLTNVRFSCHVWKMRLFLDVSNLFNTSYVDIGNLPAPGIWITGGMKAEVKRQK